VSLGKKQKPNTMASVNLQNEKRGVPYRIVRKLTMMGKKDLERGEIGKGDKRKKHFGAAEKGTSEPPLKPSKTDAAAEPRGGEEEKKECFTWGTWRFRTMEGKKNGRMC